MANCFPGRHPSTKPRVIDDSRSKHDCVVNWYHFYKAKQDKAEVLVCRGIRKVVAFWLEFLRRPMHQLE
ncbi:hypothetical protein OUZ56_013475 [Daphnia magna]|uniref:Uncharacterized protein n=1 Tax=Daphnia magna TaxID=35525 RepID=A0ABQ9Z5Z9_9CRUS|nr:hypothetical protein OUZ56_013475 [Daphnia magna]